MRPTAIGLGFPGKVPPGQDNCMDIKEHLPPKEQPAVVLLVLQEPLRQSLAELLQENGFVPRLGSNPQEVIRLLRKKKCATVFVDCEALKIYGPATCAKFKVACQYCRIILLCDKTQETHRKIIRDAMEIGIYACLLPPYEDWEILSMVSYYPRRRSL
jgi:DNA-binding response OmpR family regulator